MTSDEEFARQLQEEFDKEARLIEIQNEKDSLIAQKLASKAHEVSDSESDCEAEIPSIKQYVKDTSYDDESSTSTLLNTGDDDKLPEASKGHKRQLCEYGSDCYRKNPVHLAEFYHPESGGSGVKKIKLGDSPCIKNPSYNTKPFKERLKLSEPYHFFLNKNFSVPDTQKDWLTLVFPDLLHPSLGTLVESAQINFMIDLEFVMDFYKAYKVDKTPILFMYGELEGSSRCYESLTCSKVNMPFQYGVHHSKMMLLQYKEGLRVVIHTANLIPDDWNEKTQGFWVSPLFSVLVGAKASVLEGESKTGFKRDLVEYLLSYKNPHMTRWSHIVKEHDFTACKVHFIGSVPGYHTGESRFRFGHLKCRQLVRKWSKWKTTPKLPVVAQCSSIGSLGKDSRSWLTGEFGVSLMGGNANNNSTVKLLYPSKDDVSNSSQGYGGGSCLPYNSKTHQKQTWLKDHMHCWRSDNRFRTRAMPHIKTYTRLSTDGDQAQFFMLTSANLSKAAWGQLQKQETQLFIRSYEAGVLWLPDNVIGEDYFSLKSEQNENSKFFSLPYDLPLTPYPTNGVPWLKDTPKSAPDVMGSTYL